MDNIQAIYNAVFTFGGIIAIFMTVAGIDLIKDYFEERRK